MTALPSSHPKDDLKASPDTSLLPTDANPTDEAPPPSYTASTNGPSLSSPPLNLSFTTLPQPPHPLTLLMAGSSRCPDFTVTLPMNPSSAPIFNIDTASTLLHHHTHIHDHRPRGVMHMLKRTVVSGPGVDAPRSLVRGIAGRKAKDAAAARNAGRTGEGSVPEGEWRYAIQAAGKEGKRLLEVSTTAEGLLGEEGEDEGGGKETRLVFRRGDDGELNALRLHTMWTSTDGMGGDKKGKGKGKARLQMTVSYQGRRVGEIVLLGSSEKPEFRIEVEVAGVDPLLLVVLALVVDDRWMGEKRRFRQEFGRGWTGVGKGPGAGLAAAFAL